MKRAIGKCGSCGGIVSVPHIWHGVNRPPATCESCGRTADTAAHLPTLPMKPRAKGQPLFRELHEQHLSRQTGWPLSSEDMGASVSTAQPPWQRTPGDWRA